MKSGHRLPLITGSCGTLPVELVVLMLTSPPLELQQQLLLLELLPHHLSQGQLLLQCRWHRSLDLQWAIVQSGFGMTRLLTLPMTGHALTRLDMQSMLLVLYPLYRYYQETLQELQGSSGTGTGPLASPSRRSQRRTWIR